MASLTPNAVSRVIEWLYAHQAVDRYVVLGVLVLLGLTWFIVRDRR